MTTRFRDEKGDLWRMVMFRVESTREDLPIVNGFPIPESATFIEDNDVVEVNRNVETGASPVFFTAYVPESVFGPPPPKPKDKT